MKQTDFRDYLRELQEMPIASTASLIGDSFFLGYHMGKSGKSLKSIEASFKVIKKLNEDLENDKLGLQDKLTLYHLNIDMDQEIEFLGQLKQNHKPQKEEIQQIQMKSQILLSSFKQQVILDTECTICTDQMNLNNIIALSNCPHIFHKECITQYIHNQNKLPIRCPEVNCEQEIEVEDLNQLCDKNFLEKLDQFAFNDYLLKNGNNLFKCPTPNCPMVVETDQQKYTCDACRISYCTRCKKQFHTGICGEQSFIRVAQQQKFKFCTNCSTWVEKNEGCNHMTCKCGFEFCYICANQWNGQSKCKKCRNIFRGPLNSLQTFLEHLF